MIKAGHAQIIFKIYGKIWEWLSLFVDMQKPERGKRNEDWILIKGKSCVQRQVLKPMKQACIDIDLAAGGGLPGDGGKEYEWK